MALAATQNRLITSRQLRVLGVPDSTVHWHDELGSMLTRVIYSVHRTDGDGPLSNDQRDLAALLYTGTDAMLTGHSALRRYGFRSADEPGLAPLAHVHVLIAHAHRISSRDFVHIERTRSLPQPWIRDGFPLAPPARAVADAARWSRSPQAVRALVIEALQRGFTTVEGLDRERRLGQKRGSRLLRLAIEEAASGVGSVPEAELREHFIAAGWANLLYNEPLYDLDWTFLARPDVYDPDTGTCLEVDSREYHLSEESWKATMARHGRMTARGLAVLHSPPSRFRGNPHVVISEFAATAEARLGVPPPQVLRRPRTARSRTATEHVHPP